MKKAKREPLRYEQTPYEEKRWNASEAALGGDSAAAARLFTEAAALAEPEWKQDCIDKAEMFQRRAARLARGTGDRGGTAK